MPLTETARPLVVICIATHKRPRGLRRLLDGIGDLEFTDGSGPDVEVVVVDNDVGESAREVCGTRQHTSPRNITYLLEAKRGIARARNAAVTAACARNPTYIAFIDDDEVPDSLWLDRLGKAMSSFGADIITGPVLPRFEGHVACWKMEGGLFERPRYPSGTELTQARTGNVLISCRVFREMPRAFDESLQLAGGEDTEFFLRAAGAGYRIVWADNAIVYEWYPETRTRVLAILRRAYGVGHSWGRIKATRGPARNKALGALVKGLLIVPIAFVKGPVAIVEACVLVATGAGYLFGVAGVPYQQYAATQGE